jgi:hypothetical protein
MVLDMVSEVFRRRWNEQNKKAKIAGPGPGQGPGQGPGPGPGPHGRVGA